MPRTSLTPLRALLAGCIVALGLGVATAAGDSALGAWNRDDGRGGIRILPCGEALCGDVAWLRDPGGPAHIGERLLVDMKPTAANQWSGSAHNPEDGRDYSGTMTVEGDHLTTRGCIFGGLICQSIGLTRVR